MDNENADVIPRQDKIVNCWTIYNKVLLMATKHKVPTMYEKVDH